jgi:RNA polymerase sigma-70 factor (ECF subfamily)
MPGRTGKTNPPSIRRVESVHGQFPRDGEVIRDPAVSMGMSVDRKRGQQVVSEQWLLTVDEIQGRSTAEGALLRAGQAGDRAALDQLLALQERGVLAVCRGILHHAEDAEDAAQETLFRALSALPRFRGDASFRTWLLRIAVNVSLNWRRARRPTEPLDEEDSSVPSGVASPEEIVLLRLQVNEALGGLPPERRAVFLLREQEGWDVAEIGAAMGWNVKRVYNELFKARRSLTEWQARSAKDEEP